MSNDDLVTLPFQVTRKQRDWLETLGSDLRSNSSTALRSILQQHVEASEEDIYPTRHIISKNFEYLLNLSVTAAQSLLVELQTLIAIKLKEDEARELRRSLVPLIESRRKKTPTNLEDNSED